MTDTATKQRLTVSATDTEWPYISLPDSQVAEVQRILDDAGVRYEVDEIVISWDGGPELARVNLRRGTDGAAVQKLLDAAN